MKEVAVKGAKAAKLKILSSRGETLTEVLVSLLIAGLALAMFAGMIQASVNIVSSSETKMQQYYTASNTLAKKDPLEADAKGGSVSLKKGTTTYNLFPTYSSVPVHYFTNNKLGGIDVMSYEGNLP